METKEKVHRTIAKLSLGSYGAVTPKKIRDFCDIAEAQAIREGYEKLTYGYDHTPDDFETSETCYLTLNGERLETDAEVKARIAHNNSFLRKDYNEFKRLKKHFESEAGRKEIADIELGII